MTQQEIEEAIGRIKSWIFFKEKEGISFDKEGFKDLQLILSIAQMHLQVMKSGVPEKFRSNETGDPEMINNLTIKNIKVIRKRLEWTEEFKKDGRKWLAEARKIRDEFGLTDRNVLDIANDRFQSLLNIK